MDVVDLRSATAEFSFSAGVLAVMVTGLVTMRVWQEIRAQQFSRDGKHMRSLVVDCTRAVVTATSAEVLSSLTAGPLSKLSQMALGLVFPQVVSSEWNGHGSRCAVKGITCRVFVDLPAALLWAKAQADLPPWPVA